MTDAGENVRMDGPACPCGLGDDHESCCGRLHAGAPAPTAESLMRSRYSAFAVGDTGYLLRTWHLSGRPQARCSSVLCTSSEGSVASSQRRAGSFGKTGTGPTLDLSTDRHTTPSPHG